MASCQYIGRFEFRAHPTAPNSRQNACFETIQLALAMSNLHRRGFQIVSQLLETFNLAQNRSTDLGQMRNDQIDRIAQCLRAIAIDLENRRQTVGHGHRIALVSEIEPCTGFV